MLRNSLKLLICICLSCSISNSTLAQSFSSQRVKFSLFNIGFNGLASGLGAVLNKEDGQKTGKVFIRGLSRGALGGAVIDLGMSSTNLIATKQKLWLAWPSRY